MSRHKTDTVLGRHRSRSAASKMLGGKGVKILLLRRHDPWGTRNAASGRPIVRIALLLATLVVDFSIEVDRFEPS